MGYKTISPITGNNGFTNSGTSISYNINITAGTPSAILITAVMSGNTGADVITGVTFNSDAMTRINTVSDGTWRTYLYYLVNPDLGSSYANVITASGTSYIYGASHVYSNVNQTSPINANAASQSSTTSKTTNVTSTVSGCYIVGGVRHASGTGAVGAGTTLRQGAITGTNAVIDSNGQKATAGTYGLVTTDSPATVIFHNIAALAPALAGGALFYQQI